MEIEPSKLISKKVILFIVGVLIIVALTGTFYFFELRNNNGPKINSKSTVDETEKIKNENSQAIAVARSAALRPARPIDDSDHYQGSLSAPVQLIVYEDFECPFCARFYETIKEIQKNFGNQVVIAFRHFPLTSHSLAVPAALASECAAEQGKFWEMYDKLFSASLADNLSPEKFTEFAQDLEFDQVKFNQCLATEKYKSKIEEQMIEGRNFGITGTPGSLLNGQPIPGAVPFEDYTASDGQLAQGMKSLITKYLADKK